MPESVPLGDHSQEAQAPDNQALARQSVSASHGNGASGSRVTITPCGGTALINDSAFLVPRCWAAELRSLVSSCRSSSVPKASSGSGGLQPPRLWDLDNERRTAERTAVGMQLPVLRFDRSACDG